VLIKVSGGFRVFCCVCVLFSVCLDAVRTLDRVQGTSPLHTKRQEARLEALASVLELTLWDGERA